jgi:hypothetical protein
MMDRKPRHIQDAFAPKLFSIEPPLQPFALVRF